MSSLPSIRLAQRPAKVLLVEDDEGLRAASSACLQRRGHEVVAVASAEEAEDFLSRKTPGLKVELVVTDFELPGRSGLDLIRSVRRGAPSESLDPAIPILVVSSVVQRHSEALYAAGASSLLEKPCGPRDLVEAVDRLCVAASG